VIGAALARWATTRQHRSRHNARTACTVLADRRHLRLEVEEFLASVRAGPLDGPLTNPSTGPSTNPPTGPFPESSTGPFTGPSTDSSTGPFTGPRRHATPR
jgi:hypothetical protein